MSSKHDHLTIKEIDDYQLPSTVTQLLESCSTKFDIPYSSLRVLDWGCGRGMTVIKLLQMGIDAYGVDIDPATIRNGLPAMSELGLDGENRLICITPDCITPFTNSFFHVILSDQVFEHVSDINALTAELARLTCSEGEGLHSFPAKWCVIEPHLFIPIVHWLPKNQLRFWWIRLMLNKIPIWKEVEDKSISERVETYYKYSLQKTYYRSLNQLKFYLKHHQFDVNFYSNVDPIARHKKKLHFFNFTNTLELRFCNWYVNTFKNVILVTKRH